MANNYDEVTAPGDAGSPRRIAQARYNAMPVSVRKAFEDLCESLNSIPAEHLTDLSVSTFDVFANTMLTPFKLLVASQRTGSHVSISISPLQEEARGEEKESSGTSGGSGEGSGRGGSSGAEDGDSDGSA